MVLPVHLGGIAVHLCVVLLDKGFADDGRVGVGLHCCESNGVQEGGDPPGYFCVCVCECV